MDPIKVAVGGGYGPHKGHRWAGKNPIRVAVEGQGPP